MHTIDNRRIRSDDQIDIISGFQCRSNRLRFLRSQAADIVGGHLSGAYLLVYLSDENLKIPSTNG
jgi:hypothetical protein